MKENTTIILALYQNAQGFGYACLKMPEKKLIEAGTITVRPLGIGKIVERVRKFVDFYKPTVIIVQDWDSTYSRRSKRIAEAVEAIATYTREINLPVYRYSRQQIRDVFELFGAKSKYEIAHRIVPWFPHLESRAPKIRRKRWMNEDHNMGLFDALSLILTHLYLTE